MLYHYMHNSCFSLTFILSHLKLVLILWDTLWCLYHLPDSAIRFSLWITQLLCSPFSANPAKSSFFILPPARSSHTRHVQAEYDIRVLMFWAGDIEGPCAPGISSLPLSALQYSFDKHDFFIWCSHCPTQLFRICHCLPGSLLCCSKMYQPCIFLFYRCIWA